MSDSKKPAVTIGISAFAQKRSSAVGITTETLAVNSGFSIKIVLGSSAAKLGAA
jgi:hypothetical protein